jgi:hypothetical protein
MNIPANNGTNYRAQERTNRINRHGTLKINISSGHKSELCAPTYVATVSSENMSLILPPGTLKNAAPQMPVMNLKARNKPIK